VGLSWRASWRGLRRLLQPCGRRSAALGPPRRSASLFEDSRREARLLHATASDGLTLAASDAAEARAHALLLRLLSPVQREEFERRNCLTVTVPGRGRFAILPRRTLNVLNLDSGECYCCITASEVPLSDLMLAQKLLLEHDPEQFFAVANCPSEFLFGTVTGGAPGRRPRRSGGVLSRMRW
jgi:hypothetical protein